MDHAPKFDPHPAARRLADAWTKGAVLDGLPEAERPRSIQDGYAIQAELRQLLGEPVTGYKLGMSSAAGMRASGIGGPAWGFMTASRIHPSTVCLPVPPSGKVLMELEVCFRLGERLPAAGASAAEKLAGVANAYVGLEVVSSRFGERMLYGVPGFLADDVAFYAYVLGDEIARSDWSAVFAAPATINLDGRRYCETAQGEARTDPVEALSLFIDEAAAIGLPLRPGMLITTGNLVLPNESAATGFFAGRLASHCVACTIE